MKKNILYFCLLGFVYVLIEFFMRAFSFDIHTYSTSFKYLSLIGISSVWMFLVGGVAGVLLGLLNASTFMNEHVNIFWQSVIGALIILACEFVSGCILNLWLHFNIWNYTFPGNLLGQICIEFAVVWFLICPFAFWMNDLLKYYLFSRIAPYTLKEIYAQLFKINAKPFI